MEERVPPWGISLAALGALVRGERHVYCAQPTPIEQKTICPKTLRLLLGMLYIAK